MAWEEPSPAPAALSSSPSGAPRRPITIWAAIGLALASGVLVFVVDVRLSLLTNSLVAQANASLPPGTPAPVDATTSALVTWAPLIIGLVVLLAYVFVARRLYRRHPKAVKATVVVAAIYIAFSMLNIVGGRPAPQAPFSLALNGALLALVLLPVSRAYFKVEPARNP